MGHDLRKYARQTNFRLILGFIFLLFIVGDGLIYVFYGPGAALMGLICLVGSLIPVGLIILTLWMIDWVAKQHR